MSEHDIQSSILELITRKGGIATRVNSGGSIAKRGKYIRLAPKGTSDIIACYRGVPLYIEVKRDGECATDEQIDFLERVAEAGGVGLVAYNVGFVHVVLVNADYGGTVSIKKHTCLDLYIPNRLFVR
jgi:hypothetical protein